MTTLSEMMAHIRNRLAVADIEDPMAEARILVGGIVGLTRTDFITKGDEHLDPDDEARIHDAVGRRLGGEPPYRILGRRAFYGLELGLSKDTLEPRPDTEVLVDLVLALIGDRSGAALSILDLGTGTGAICLALLSELPGATGTGVDIAEGALVTARENAALNGLSERFAAIRSDWFGGVDGAYDVIVSNPPYIRSDVVTTLDREVREHDPLIALDGGGDGLDAYRAIAAGCRGHLKPGGFVAVETGFDQRAAVRDVFAAAGFFEIAARKDLAGNDRVQAFRPES